MVRQRPTLKVKSDPGSGRTENNADIDGVLRGRQKAPFDRLSQWARCRRRAHRATEGDQAATTLLLEGSDQWTSRTLGTD